MQRYLLKICVTINEPPAFQAYRPRDAAAGDAYRERCPGGSEPFWSAATLHQTHILLFIVALVHVAYPGVTTYLVLRKVPGPETATG